MKILIAGDSFAAEWPSAVSGWVNLLSKKYQVTNVAQAGCSEYKILKQIQGQNLKTFDLIIVSHTSPSRVYTAEHPLHKEGFHKNCDLIATDISNRVSWFNSSLKAAQGWFKYHYDDQYQLDIYSLIRKEINQTINIPYISLSHIEFLKDISFEKYHLDFSNLWANERGSINHYTEFGNKLIYKDIDSCINQISQL